MLSLNTFFHPKPYKLHWIQKDGNMVVTQQVNV